MQTSTRAVHLDSHGDVGAADELLGVPPARIGTVADGGAALAQRTHVGG